MDEPFLPWWNLLLLGLLAAALTVWQRPTFSREIRIWAGISLLAYLGLIFFALGLAPRQIQPAITAPPMASDLGQVSMLNIVWPIVVAVGMFASCLMAGHISFASRKCCYAVLTVANAMYCFCFQATEIGCGLLIVAGLSAWPLMKDLRHFKSWSSQQMIASLLQTDNSEATGDSNDAGETWLIGFTHAVIAMALIGIVAYSLKTEAVRTTPNPRASALPTDDILAAARLHKSAEEKSESLFDLVTGYRAEIAVLLATMIFLCLAISLDDSQHSKLAGFNPAGGSAMGSALQRDGDDSMDQEPT